MSEQQAVINKYLNKKILVTTQGWFYGKDGRSYRAVHGTLKGVHEASKVLGFSPNRSHANWFIEIGNILIMGCQVMYIVECEAVHTGNVKDWITGEQTILGIKEYDRPSVIYLAD